MSTGPDERARIRIRDLLRGPVDWDLAVRAASLHRVLPLVYRNLRQIDPEGVPSPVLSLLRDAYLRNAARNLRLATRLKEICGLLGERGIEAVPFKGPVLAQEVFGDLALRQFTDLDVLVPRNAAMRNKSLPFGGSHHGAPLDLHWDLSGDYTAAGMTYDALEADFRQVELLGAPLVTLGDRDLVLYLCLHATMESWSRLDHVCCVAELIRKHPDLTGPETLERAGLLHLRRCFLAGCGLAHGLLDADLPGFLLDEVERDANVRKYVRLCMERLFAGRSGEYGAARRPKFGGAHFLLKDRALDRVRHMLFLVLSPTIEDWRRLPVPGSLGFLLYGYRPSRLFLDYARGRASGLAKTR